MRSGKEVELEAEVGVQIEAGTMQGVEGEVGAEKRVEQNMDSPAVIGHKTMAGQRSSSLCRRRLFPTPFLLNHHHSIP